MVVIHTHIASEIYKLCLQ